MSLIKSDPDKVVKAFVDWLYYFHPELKLADREIRKLRDEWIKPSL